MQGSGMRWTIRIGAALALLWVAYAVSPYIAAYRLAAAVQARDVEAIRARVDFRALRLSLAKQILAIYLTTTGDGGTSEAAARQLATAAVEIAEPLMAQLLSPEVLLDLLDDGWPQSIVAEKPADAPAPGRAAAPEPEAAQPVRANRIGLG